MDWIGSGENGPMSNSGVLPSSVQKAMSSGGSGMTELMAYVICSNTWIWMRLEWNRREVFLEHRWSLEHCDIGWCSYSPEWTERANRVQPASIYRPAESIIHARVSKAHALSPAAWRCYCWCHSDKWETTARMVWCGRCSAADTRWGHLTACAYWHCDMVTIESSVQTDGATTSSRYVNLSGYVGHVTIFIWMVSTHAA